MSYGCASGRRGRGYRPVGLKWVCFNEGTKYYKNKKANVRQARVGGVSFFEDTYYSFNTPVMKYHDGPHGKFVLITSQTFSQTTTSHVNVGMHSITVPSIRVPFIGAPGGWSDEPSYMSMYDRDKGNMAYLWFRITQLRDKLIRRYRDMDYDGKPYEQTPWPARYYNDGYTSWDGMFRPLYSDLFAYQRNNTGAELPAGYMPQNELIPHIKQVREEKYRAWSDPKAVQKRERSRARKLLTKALGHD